MLLLVKKILFLLFFDKTLAFYNNLCYNQIVVIPLITSLISNPNTPFNKRELFKFSFVFLIYVIFLLYIGMIC